MLSTMAMSALFMMPHSQHAFDTAFRQRNIGLDSAYSRSLTSVHISPRVLTATRRLASSFASEISTVPSTNTVVGLTEHFVSDTIVSKSNLGLRIALPASVRSFGCEYCSALKSWPLRTNALTSALLFALGDVVAQIETGSRFLGTSSTPWMLRPLMLDFSRLVKYSFTGVGYGVIWSYWWEPLHIPCSLQRFKHPPILSALLSNGMLASKTNRKFYHPGTTHLIRLRARPFRAIWYAVGGAHLLCVWHAPQLQSYLNKWWCSP